MVDEVKYKISRGLEKNGIKIHSLVHRFKAFDSFLGKIKRKDFRDPFNEMHDLIGFRIICLFLDDINRTGEMLTHEFDVVDIEDKIESESYDVFGYMGSHYKVKLKEAVLEIDYVFEIQLRTIAQDAWASISHHLKYKKDDHMADNLKRDIHALSALFYIADKNWLLLRNELFKSLAMVGSGG